MRKAGPVRIPWRSGIKPIAFGLPRSNMWGRGSLSKALLCCSDETRLNGELMDLNDFSGPKPDVIDLRAEDRWAAIDELINHLVKNGRIKPEHKEAIATAVKARESAMSTGVGFGIGIPHASTDLVSDVVAAIGRSQKGVQFSALDDKPVRLVLLFLVPTGQFQKHVNTLADIVKLLHRQDFRDGLWRRFM